MRNLVTIALLFVLVNTAEAQFIQPIKTRSQSELKTKAIHNTIATAIVGTASGFGIAATYLDAFPGIDQNLQRFLYIPTTVGAAATVITGYSAYRNFRVYRKNKKGQNISLISTPFSTSVVINF